MESFRPKNSKSVGRRSRPPPPCWSGLAAPRLDMSSTYKSSNYARLRSQNCWLDWTGLDWLWAEPPPGFAEPNASSFLAVRWSFSFSDVKVFLWMSLNWANRAFLFVCGSRSMRRWPTDRPICHNTQRKFRRKLTWVRVKGRTLCTALFSFLFCFYYCVELKWALVEQDSKGSFPFYAQGYWIVCTLVCVRISLCTFRWGWEEGFPLGLRLVTAVLIARDARPHPRPRPRPSPLAHRTTLLLINKEFVCNAGRGWERFGHRRGVGLGCDRTGRLQLSHRGNRTQ